MPVDDTRSNGTNELLDINKTRFTELDWGNIDSDNHNTLYWACTDAAGRVVDDHAELLQRRLDMDKAYIYRRQRERTVVRLQFQGRLFHLQEQ